MVWIGFSKYPLKRKENLSRAAFPNHDDDQWTIQSRKLEAANEREHKKATAVYSIISFVGDSAIKVSSGPAFVNVL